MTRNEATPSMVLLPTLAVLLLLAGCQEQAHSPQGGTASFEDRKADALFRLQKFVWLEKDIAESYESEPMLAMEFWDRTRWIEWDLEMESGYQFKGDFKLWDRWRRWLVDRDGNVVREILDAPESIEDRGDPSMQWAAITFATDVAFEGGKKEDIDYVKAKYEWLLQPQIRDDSNFACAIRTLHHALDEGSPRTGGPSSTPNNRHEQASKFGDADPNAPACVRAHQPFRYERAFKLTDRTYVRLAEVMERNDKDLDEIQEMLIKKECEEYGNRAQAARYSHLIVVAHTDSVSSGRMDSFGVSDCTMKVSVTKILKGACDRKQISFNAHVHDERGQFDPDEGKSYIFFLDVEPDLTYSFVKMSPASDRNVAEITKLIAETMSKPAGPP